MPDTDDIGMDSLRIAGWEKWQSYRRDRGQPPWIKVHRILMRNLDWVALSDAERGQLVAIWLLAADHDGVIPASPALIKQLCYMDSEPKINTFVKHGFIEHDANMTSRRRQHVALETETETEIEKEQEREVRVPEKVGAKKITQDWQPNSKAIEWVSSFGISPDDAVHVVVEFRAYWLSRSTRRKNWSLAFMRNGKVENSLIKLKTNGGNGNGNQWQKNRIERFYEQLRDYAQSGK